MTRGPGAAPGRARVMLCGLMVAGLMVAGCGVPVERTPSALPRKDIPFGLLKPSAPSTTTTSVSSPVTVTVRVFMVASTGHLFAVARQVPAAQPALTAVLQELIRGPTNLETGLGLQSAIPAQTMVLGTTMGTDEVATVNLGTTFGQLVGQAQIQAVAQIVFTAAALPGIAGVSFELAGKPVDVPVASGAEVPVANPADFGPLAPVATTASDGSPMLPPEPMAPGSPDGGGSAPGGTVGP